MKNLKSPVIVDASSVQDFVDRYMKPRRVSLTTVACMERDLAEYGNVAISSHDSTTGRLTYWPIAD